MKISFYFSREGIVIVTESISCDLRLLGRILAKGSATNHIPALLDKGTDLWPWNTVKTRDKSKHLYIYTYIFKITDTKIFPLKARI